MNQAHRFLGAFCAIQMLLVVHAATGSDWKIHEWGTFTSLQDEAGRSITGINTDDEPVPPFVHRLSHFVVLKATQAPRFFFQGAPSAHADVTMRLETPVVYFHPPASFSGIQPANLTVQFRGGWLTEFYPAAQPDAPGLRTGQFDFGPLGSETISRLEWNDFKIGGDWPLTNTTEHVWTSPRAVDAALVRTPNGESEKFLFYRGVAHLDAPLRVSREAGHLVLRSQLNGLPMDKPPGIKSLWLVDIRPGGKIAFRPLPGLTLETDSSHVLARTPAEFPGRDYSTGNLAKLRDSLQTALVAEGLFADEAQALLNTWELSYFKSEGLRLFFIVPPVWTDHYLPLSVSLPAEITRVMVGRIELVTPEQRRRLGELAEFTEEDIKADAQRLGKNYWEKVADLRSEEARNTFSEVTTGSKPLTSFISVPKSYRTYLELGRFRNALLLDELKRRPTEGLNSFVSTYRLESYPR